MPNTVRLHRVLATNPEKCIARSSRRVAGAVTHVPLRFNSGGTQLFSNGFGWLSAGSLRAGYQTFLFEEGGGPSSSFVMSTARTIRPCVHMAIRGTGANDPRKRTPCTNWMPCTLTFSDDHEVRNCIDWVRCQSAPSLSINEPNRCASCPILVSSPLERAETCHPGDPGECANVVSSQM
jgi:hypothetical protein